AIADDIRDTAANLFYRLWYSPLYIGGRASNEPAWHGALMHLGHARYSPYL
ncbi:hypothetical protein LCGC14_2072530, partial [marine sediment metagenome]